MIHSLKPKFKVRDEFFTTRNPGSVHGTASEPVGTARTVVDTETALSIVPKVGTALATQAGVTFGGSNNRCSYDASGANTAWMDFPTGFNAAAYADQGLIVIMFDSAGVGAWCYLGAAGSGETLGTDVVLYGDFADDTKWTCGVGVSVAGGKLVFTSVASTVGALRPVTLVPYALYKGTCVIDSISGGTLMMGLNGSVTIIGEPINSTGNKSGYATQRGLSSEIGFGFYRYTSTVTAQVDDYIVKKVLTPSATGVYAYKDAALSVSGWNKPTAFNMNSASYTFGIYEPQSRGKLFCMGGKASPAWGDPGFWLNKAITRSAGQVIAFKVNVRDVTSKVELGLDADKTGELTGHRIRIDTDKLYYYDGTTASAVVGIPADATDYVFVIILRAAGALFFRKTSTGYYKFLGEVTTNNTASLYAGISNYSAAWGADFLRICNYNYLPAPVLSDSFTGDAGTNDGRLSDGLAHAETSGLGSGGAGVAWSGASGAVDGSGSLIVTPTVGDELNSGDIVVGNWYLITATQANFFYTGCAIGDTFRCATAKTLSADNKVKLITFATCYNKVTLTSKDFDITANFSMTTGKSAGVIIGLNTAGTSFILARHNGAGNIVLEICEAGTYTSKASVAAAYSADAPLRVRRDDREIWVWYNGVLIGTGPTTTLSEGENTNLSGLNAGLFSTSENNSFSAARIRYIGNAGEYDILRRIVE